MRGAEASLLVRPTAGISTLSRKSSTMLHASCAVAGAWPSAEKGGGVITPAQLLPAASPPEDTALAPLLVELEAIVHTSDDFGSNHGTGAAGGGAAGDSNLFQLYNQHRLSPQQSNHCRFNLLSHGYNAATRTMRQSWHGLGRRNYRACCQLVHEGPGVRTLCLDLSLTLCRCLATPFKTTEPVCVHKIKVIAQFPLVLLQ